MIPRNIAGATHRLGAPKGWNPETDGTCGVLPVRIAEGCCLSAWEPTPDELVTLNAGGSVILQVVGGQPPVMLWAEPARERPRALTDETFKAWAKARGAMVAARPGAKP